MLISWDTRAPNLLGAPSKDIIARIQKVKKLFESSEAIGGIDMTGDSIRHWKKMPKNLTNGNQTSNPSISDGKNDIDDSSDKIEALQMSKGSVSNSFIRNIDDAIQYFPIAKDTVFTKENALRYARELKAAIQYNDDDYMEGSSSIFDLDSMADQSYAYSSGLVDIPVRGELLTGPQTQIKMSNDTPVVRLMEEIKDDKSNDFDITRIIMGNVDTFYDRFPYFLQLISGWIEAMDPVMAHLILDAIPSVLPKAPSRIRPILKYLYGEITLGNIIDAKEHESPLSTPQDGITIDTGANKRKMNRQSFYKLLREAPKVVRLSVEDIKKRMNDLSALFAQERERIHHNPNWNQYTSSQVLAISSISNANSEIMSSRAPLPVIAAPRLLSEINMNRLWYKKNLLKEYISLGYIVDKSSDLSMQRAYLSDDMKYKYEVSNIVVNTLIRKYPKLLTEPLSIIMARIPFIVNVSLLTSNIPVNKEGDTLPAFTGRSVVLPISIDDCPILAHCNTNEFLEEIIILYQSMGLGDSLTNPMNLEEKYKRHLRLMFRTVSSYRGSNNSPDSMWDDEEDVSTLEGELCGYLNDLCERFQ